MNLKVFMVYDTVSQKTVAYFDAPNAGIVIRNNYKYFEKINPYYKEDWKIFEVGYIDSDGMPIYNRDTPYRQWSWSEYNTPEQEAVPMTSSEKAALQNQPTGISGAMPEKL